jgi:hypothetical protein
VRYTITALTPSEETIEVMRRSLRALGAPADAISTKRGEPGLSQHHIAVRTDDLELSECYREALELAGGRIVTSSEESSALAAVAPRPPA